MEIVKFRGQNSQTPEPIDKKICRGWLRRRWLPARQNSKRSPHWGRGGVCVKYHSRVVFSARCNTYISRLCYDVSVYLSVRLSVMFVHFGHSVRWIPDIFACLDRWMSLLLTDNASPGSSDGISGGRRGGMKKLVIVAISLILLTESLDQKFLLYQRCWHFYNRSCWRVFFSNLGRKCIISEERFMLELPTSRAMLATARPSCFSVVNKSTDHLDLCSMAVQQLYHKIIVCLCLNGMHDFFLIFSLERKRLNFRLKQSTVAISISANCLHFYSHSPTAWFCSTACIHSDMHSSSNFGI